MLEVRFCWEIAAAQRSQTGCRNPGRISKHENWFGESGEFGTPVKVEEASESEVQQGPAFECLDRELRLPEVRGVDFNCQSALQAAKSINPCAEERTRPARWLHEGRWVYPAV